MSKWKHAIVAAAVLGLGTWNLEPGTARAAQKPRASAAKPVKAALPFTEDDYGRARAEARSRKLPLFVEVWAPW